MSHYGLNGRFLLDKIPIEFSEIPRAQWNGTVTPAAQTLPKPVRAFSYCSCKKYTKVRYWGDLRRTIWSNGKGHFFPTDQNEDRSKWTMHLQIPVGPNRSGPFQWMYQPKFSEFWVEWKAPTELLEMRFEFPFTRLALLAMAFWTFQSWRVLNLGKHFTTQNTFSALFRWRT